MRETKREVAVHFYTFFMTYVIVGILDDVVNVVLPEEWNIVDVNEQKIVD